MANFLNAVCRNCRRDDRIEIAAHIWLRLTEDGTTPDDAHCGDHEYYPHSPALCVACGHTGTVRDFDTEAAS